MRKSAACAESRARVRSSSWGLAKLGRCVSPPQSKLAQKRPGGNQTLAHADRPAVS